MAFMSQRGTGPVVEVVGAVSGVLNPNDSGVDASGPDHAIMKDTMKEAGVARQSG